MQRFLCCGDFGGCAVCGRGDVSGSADAGDGIDVRDWGWRRVKGAVGLVISL